MVTGDNVYQGLGNPDKTGSLVVAGSSAAEFLPGDKREPLKCSVDNTNMLACKLGKSNIFQQRPNGQLWIGEGIHQGNKQAGLRLVPYLSGNSPAKPCFSIAGRRFVIRADQSGLYAYLPTPDTHGSRVEFTRNSAVSASQIVFREDCTIASSDNQRIAMIDKGTNEVRFLTEEYIK